MAISLNHAFAFSLFDNHVFLSSYPGMSSTYQLSELIGNYSYINSDLLLLKQRQKISQYYQQQNQSENYPQFIIGGKAQPRAFYMQPYAGNDTKNIILYKSEIDTEALATSWLTGFMSVAYNPNADPFNVSDDPNNKVFIDRAFVTLGDLSQQPIYSTLGQVYVPFGNYSSYMITDPLTLLLARTRGKVALLGYAQDNIYAQAYSFAQANMSTATAQRIPQSGFNLDYMKSQNLWSVDVGGGMIRNLADSQRMQTTNTSSGFTGFNSTSEILQHAVPAADLHGKVTYGHWGALAEWVSATQSFAKQNLSFDNHGAKPQAFTTEGAYNFSMFDKPSYIAAGYGFTRDALALNLAKTRYVATISTQLWHHTTEGIEFKHELNYPVGSTASGQNKIIKGGSALGQSSNTVTAQIAFYF